MAREREKHYLGLTYAQPNEAGLASEAKAVGKKLARLLDALGEVNAWIIHPGELTEHCFTLRMDRFRPRTRDYLRSRIAVCRSVLSPRVARHFSTLCS